MTLWYWSRSHSSKSTSFDFTTVCQRCFAPRCADTSKDIYTSVRVLAAFIFATMQELGYDACSRRVLDKSCEPPRSRLVFRVGGRYFKVLRTISEHLGVCITGRATRVFEVVEVHSFDSVATIDPNQPKILKDVWLDEDARSEGEIQSAIFEDLDELARHLLPKGAPEPLHFSGMEAAEKTLLLDALRDRNYQKHFLTIPHGASEKVFVSKEVPVGAVSANNVFAHPHPKLKPSIVLNGDTSRSGLAYNALCSSMHMSPEKRPNPLRRKFKPKNRHLTVYEEVCKALHKVPDLPSVLKALKDCLLGASQVVTFML